MDIDVLTSLSDPRRLAILRLLADGERCLCDISSELGISDALASHHLKKLRESGLVIAERRGVWLHCRLDPEALDALGAGISALAEGARAAERSAARCCPAPASGSRS